MVAEDERITLEQQTEALMALVLVLVLVLVMALVLALLLVLVRVLVRVLVLMFVRVLVPVLVLELVVVEGGQNWNMAHCICRHSFARFAPQALRSLLLAAQAVRNLLRCSFDVFFWKGFHKM